jgi:hypothetical protein
MNHPLIPPIPKYIETWESLSDPLAKKYPLQLITTHSKRRAHSQFDNLPWLKEQQPQMVTINSLDAESRGIRQGDPVKVFNNRGEMLIQAWVGQFVLPGWDPINPHRSLVLILIGYGEITIIYARLAYIFRNQFEGIYCLRQAFGYSVRNAVTIGSSTVKPVTNWGYAIFVSQLMFIILFLTSVVSRIIARK